MSSFTYAVRAQFRAGARTAAYLVGLALAIALFSTTLFFVAGSTRGMTQRAAAPVLLDFQARASDPTMDITAAAGSFRQQAGVQAVLPFASAAATLPAPPAANGNPGSLALAVRLLAMPPDYLATFPLLTVTTGAFPIGGALVSEQLAASRHLKVGDTLVLAVPGLPQPYQVHLTGTVTTELADQLFTGPTAAPEGAYNVAAGAVVLDYTTFSRDLAGPLRRAMEQARLQAGPAGTGTVLGLPILDQQLHIKVARASLPADPGQAELAVARLRRALERQAPGQTKITDNLTNALVNAKSDVTSARLLFVFLGLPGVLLAAYLSRYAAQLMAEAQRGEVALLRTRGLSSRQIAATMAWATILVALLGTAIGVALGAAGAAAIFGAASFGDWGSVLLVLVCSLVLGLVLGGVGVLLPARRMLQGEINEERRVVAASQRPIWLRLPLDFLLLAAAGLALWFSGTYSSKGALAGASETSAVSLGVYAFLGPLLFWLGAALLFLRLADWQLARPPRRWRGSLGGLVDRSLHRRSRQSAGAALLVALALSFGVATAIFGATYGASRRAEARYLIGSDVRVTPALTNPQPLSFTARLKVAGVQAVAPVYVANDALVGTQTQTVYGVDIATLSAATAMPDSFFVGQPARQVLQQLATTPDGLLVSSELAKSYNIQTGDTVKMRLPTRSGSFTDVALRVTGLFTMFPTSSQNSDLVVNSAFLVQATNNPNPAFFLLKGDGTATTDAAVARQLAQAFGGQLAARVDTASRTVSQDQSSLTGLNLSGLLAIDRAYAALIVALGLAVYLFGSVLERQREFGTLQALGATPGQVTRLLVAEGAMLLVGGVIGGLVIGLPLAWQYTAFLPGIFAVTLPVPTIPMRDLSLLLALGLFGATGAALLAALRLRRLWPADVLRDA